MTNAEIVTDFIAAWEARDVERIMSHFAPGASYHNIPMPKMTGHDQIRPFIANFLADAKTATFEVVHAAENADGAVLNERIDTFVMNSGKTLRLAVMGVFELKGGKITAWRDYFDMKDFERQMAG